MWATRALPLNGGVDRIRLVLSSLARPTSILTARIRRGGLALFLGALSWLPLGAIANPELSYDVWRVEDEGEPSTATSIVQSRDGYLWVGTYTGLARFDGVRLVFFTSANTPGLRSSRITSLYLDPADTLWIGHESGEVSRLIRGRFESVTLPRKWQGGAIDAIAQDEQNDFWLLNDRGKVFRLRDGEELEVPGGATASRKAVLIQGNNRQPWVCANGRVAAIEQGKMVEKRFEETGKAVVCDRILAAREGGFWVCIGGVVKRWDNGKWAATAGELPADATGVNALLETRSGMLVAGTINNGLYLLAPGASPIHINRGNGLSHDWVRTLCEDHERNLWVGTGGGLDTLRTRKVTMVNPPDRFLGRVLLSFTRGSKGEMWIGTEGAGLYRNFQDNWTRFDETAGLSNVFVWSVLETTRKELLVGTWGGGLQKLRVDRFETPGGIQPDYLTGGGHVRGARWNSMDRHDDGAMVLAGGAGPVRRRAEGTLVPGCPDHHANG